MKQSIFQPVLAAFIMLLAASSHALDAITEDELVKFLELEKSHLKNKDLEGYLNLMTDDYVNIGIDGKVSDKRETRLSLYKSFFSSLHVRHTSTLKSFQISSDGKSASGIIVNDTKYLIERNDNRRVIRKYSEDTADFVLIDGEIKYRKTTFLREL